MLSLLGLVHILVDPPCSLPSTQEIPVPCATVCTSLRSLYSCSRINQNFLFSQGYKRSVAIFKNDLSLKFLSSFPLPHLHLPSRHFSFLALPKYPFLQRWSNPAPTENTNGVNVFPALLNWVSMALMSCGIYEAGFPCPSPSKSSIYGDNLMMNLHLKPTQLTDDPISHNRDTP